MKKGLGTILLLLLTVSCGKTSSVGVSSEQPGSQGNPGDTIGGSTICYPGKNHDNRACAPLRKILARDLGYMDPYTEPKFPPGQNQNQYRMPIQAIDLPKANLNLPIQTNFLLGEFLSLAKGDFGILSKFLVDVVQKLRDLGGAAIRINSGFRPPAYNSGLNGAATWSRHMYGDAVDIASTSLSLDKLVELCRTAEAKFISKYAAHVHCDWRNQPLQTEFFGNGTKDFFDISDEEMLKGWYSNSQIHVAGVVKVGGVVTLSSNVDYQDDDDEIYKRWVIKAPNGKILDRESQTVTLRLQKGLYQIYHDIGGNIQLNMSLDVN